MEPSTRDVKTNSLQEKYPYPSEFDVLDFIPKLSSEANYENWKLLMLDFIKSQGLLGFIDGTATEPVESKQDDYLAWKRSNNLVRQWILATLNEDIRLGLLSSKTAEDIWIKLEDLFEGTYAYQPDEETDGETGNIRQGDLELHKAAINGDWDKAKGIIGRNPEAIRSRFTSLQQTVLSVAVQSASPPLQRDRFVKELLEKMNPEDVKQVDGLGYTALHYAALVDNMEAAKLLVGKNSDLPNVFDESGNTPLQIAACCGHKQMVLYLEGVTEPDILLKDDVAATLLCYLICGELYDIALTLLQQKPHLALVRMEPDLFTILAEKHSSFRSGNSLKFWQSLIYWVKQRLRFKVWGVAERLVPCVQRIWEKRERQHHALELVKFLCKKVANSTLSDMERKFKPTLYQAVRFGIPDEIIEEIALADPSALFLQTVDRINFIKYAIMYRRENVFNLIYQIGARHPSLISSMGDITRENGLHLAARMGRKQQIYLKASAAGALLQMQREMQWFKEVEKFTQPGDRERRNRDGKTPAELFFDTHEGLVKEGEQWMKDTANSCTILAALVATMVFAAAMTVPGGFDPVDGHPFFSKQRAFAIFGASNALALFSSLTYGMIFLVILTSRYAEEDFLYTLPSLLVIGLTVLFVSILSTVIAFSAIVYLVFGDNNNWILIPLVASASIPVTIFGALQFPLLVQMIQSTYCGGKFGKQSRHERRD